MIGAPHVSYWRRALGWAARPRHAYAILIIVGFGVFVTGVGLVFPPLAVMLAGVGAGGLGMLGLAAAARSQR